MEDVKDFISNAAKNSNLRTRLIISSAEPIKRAVEEQKGDAAIHPDREGPVLVGVRVPQWYYDVLTVIQRGSPKYRGMPVEVWEHEEVKAVFWDPTMPLDAGTSVR